MGYYGCQACLYSRLIFVIPAMCVIDNCTRWKSLDQVLGKQTIVLFPDYRVALAGACLQACPVKHRDMATPVIDQPGPLQVTGCLRHPFSPHTEHIGDQLLGHDELVGGQAVDAHEQPAAQLLI